MFKGEKKRKYVVYHMNIVNIFVTLTPITPILILLKPQSDLKVNKDDYNLEIYESSDSE